MKHLIASVLVLMAAASAQAQSGVQSGAAQKSAAQTGAKAPSRAPAKPSGATGAQREAPAPLSAAELAIAERVYLGRLPCEQGAFVSLEPDAQAPGYFKVHGKGFAYRMRPVETSTGAIRLEDQRAGAVWLQLANKSMLMDQKLGRRVVDECASPAQVAVADEHKLNPPPSLIDTSPASK